MKHAYSLLLLGAGLAGVAAQAAVPARDAPYAGVIQVDVDATDLAHRVLQVNETLPVKPGKLTLLYPQWLPGNHAPRGPIDQIAGLVIRANGHTLTWKRDPLDVYAFEVDVPKGAAQLNIAFQVATPLNSDQGRVVITSALTNVQWNQVVLYPAGHYNSAIQVASSLRLPEGWQVASALPAQREGSVYRFQQASLEEWVDSPVFSGPNYLRIDLAPGQKIPVAMNLFADQASDLVPTPAQIEIHRHLLRELYAALGQPSFDHYELLVALTDQLGGIGLEHRRSSENSHSPTYLRKWDEGVGRHYLLAHEMTHAWNGKRRRPADLWTPHFNLPMQDSLLWVYEGMTQYYGDVIASRAGLHSLEFGREGLAANAAVYEIKRPGRQWRSMLDTTNQPIVTARRPLAWTSWQRTEDYYSEGALLWLEVDMRLRGLTGGQRSLDDFAQRFFGAAPDKGVVSTYRFEDVVRTLESIAPNNWGAFLEARVNGIAQPLQGLQQAGLKLVFNDTPNLAIKDGERNRTDLSFGLGLSVAGTGVISEVVWDSPAFKAGLSAAGTTLVAVNGRAFSADVLKDAVVKAKDGEALDLLVRTADRYRTVSVEWRGGLYYPHLEVVAGATDRLNDVLKARAP
jgi:predicted metalloprotease with PDZ domain